MRKLMNEWTAPICISRLFSFKALFSSDVYWWMNVYGGQMAVAYPIQMFRA